MSIDSAIARFRRKERQLFRSECMVTRRVSPSTFNPTAGGYTEHTATVYSGACMVRRADTGGGDAEAGGREIRLRDIRLKLPADTPIVKDDVAVITSSPDAGLVGKQLRVKDVIVDDWEVSRVAIVEEVEG